MAQLINFNLENFEKTKGNKDDLSNEILYKMCADYPLHTKPEEIRAKILIIGRVYAAAIERRKKKNHINDDFYDVVVKEFIEFNNKKNFDEKLNSLKNKRFDKTTIKEILNIHNELVKFFDKITGLEKRSLASKYLHFHCPIFPIYDSRASNSLKKIVSGRISCEEEIGDKEYSKFCYKILFLNDYIKEKTHNSPSLRELDTYLLKTANKILNDKK